AASSLLGFVCAVASRTIHAVDFNDKRRCRINVAIVVYFTGQLFDGHRAPPLSMKPDQNADRAHFQRSGWQNTEPPKPSEIFSRILNYPNHPNCGNQAAETFFRADSET